MHSGMSAKPLDALTPNNYESFKKLVLYHNFAQHVKFLRFQCLLFINTPCPVGWDGPTVKDSIPF